MRLIDFIRYSQDISNRMTEYIAEHYHLLYDCDVTIVNSLHRYEVDFDYQWNPHETPNTLPLQAHLNGIV
jgi:hypothetical protein